MIPNKYVEKLRQEMAGQLLEAGDPGYDQSLVIDNGRIDLRPGMVAMCANAQDVITAYKFAVEHEMHFTVRGGGHSAAGYCLNQGGLVIDLTGMTGKRLDAERGICWAQTGNRWHDVYIYLQNVNWGYNLGEAMRPHDVGAYVNYIDPLLTNWKEEFCGGNYPRLVEIKKAVDKDNRFTFQQAAGSDFEPTPGNFAPLFRTFIA